MVGVLHQAHLTDLFDYGKRTQVFSLLRCRIALQSRKMSMVRLAMRTGLLQVCSTQEGLFKTWGEVGEMRESGETKGKQAETLDN